MLIFPGYASHFQLAKWTLDSIDKLNRRHLQMYQQSASPSTFGLVYKSGAQSTLLPEAIGPFLANLFEFREHGQPRWATVHKWL